VNVAKIPKTGERWQFRHWHLIGSTRGGVTVDRVVGQGEHPSTARDTVVVYRYDAGDTSSLPLPIFVDTYVHAPDLPGPTDADRSRPDLEVVR
jgi:hypothetical protein